MKKQLSFALVLLSALCLTKITHAQESINTSGGDATGSGGSAAYTIGQVIYTTNSSASGNVAQGVQHAYQASPVNNKGIKSSVSTQIFPNPTSDLINLQITNYKDPLQYQITDISGNIVLHGKITTAFSTLSVIDLAKASYFIHIINADQTRISSHKIIKN